MPTFRLPRLRAAGPVGGAPAPAEPMTPSMAYDRRVDQERERR